MQKMNPPQISIIVPVYKVEQYLSKCIDSILEQTYTNWELLLVDDGSPDYSGKICDEYALKDSRIKVLHKENGGVSSARNLGLDEAKGDFVMFVDSDDWLSTDCFQVCVDGLNKDDLEALQFGFISITDDKEKPHVKTGTIVLNGEKYIQANSFNVCVWGGIYKREIIEKYKLRFAEDLKLAEDQIFVLSFFKCCHRIKYLEKAMYYYLQRADSAVHTSKSKDMVLSCEYLTQMTKEWPVSKCYIDKMIVGFVKSIIRNKDTKYQIIKRIYQKQDPQPDNIDYFPSFPKIASVNFPLGYVYYKSYLYWGKLRHQIRRMIEH